ncbi:MAG: 2-amino-4-hydroxy-6-hydroxymethyldihydropteridine diphosphokinase [Nitrospinae bacterium]|nr:2-amino-4-hydroxy-6-hydroxymethyldihydropteridine diphosphokinase [Nitrospinota bacterium]
MTDRIILDSLEIECVIGIFDWERTARQKIRISLEIECDLARAAATDNIENTVDYKSISKAVIALVEPSQFFLIETMAERIAALCLAHAGVLRVTVTVSKPGAIRGARDVMVKITRPARLTRVFLGIGSNIDPLANIPAGLALIAKRFGAGRVSPVYQSEAWGVTEPQEDYFNLVVEARTDKDVFGVRAECCWIERMTGRARGQDKFAPRPLDVDLLLYGELAGMFDGGALPHPQVLTQQFVYYPMRDLAPELIVPGDGRRLDEITPMFDTPDLRIEKLENVQWRETASR